MNNSVLDKFAIGIIYSEEQRAWVCQYCNMPVTMAYYVGDFCHDAYSWSAAFCNCESAGKFGIPEAKIEEQKKYYRKYV